jgi:hypothetical protein
LIPRIQGPFLSQVSFSILSSLLLISSWASFPPYLGHFFLFAPEPDFCQGSWYWCSCRIHRLIVKFLPSKLKTFSPKLNLQIPHIQQKGWFRSQKLK